jgi:hypothetical protein
MNLKEKIKLLIEGNSKVNNDLTRMMESLNQGGSKA